MRRVETIFRAVLFVYNKEARPGKSAINKAEKPISEKSKQIKNKTHQIMPTGGAERFPFTHSHLSPFFLTSLYQFGTSLISYESTRKKEEKLEPFPTEGDSKRDLTPCAHKSK